MRARPEAPFDRNHGHPTRPQIANIVSELRKAYQDNVIPLRASLEDRAKALKANPGSARPGELQAAGVIAAWALAFGTSTGPQRTAWRELGVFVNTTVAATAQLREVAQRMYDLHINKQLEIYGRLTFTRCASCLQKLRGASGSSTLPWRCPWHVREVWQWRQGTNPLVQAPHRLQSGCGCATAGTRANPKTVPVPDTHRPLLQAGEVVVQLPGAHD